MSQYIRELEISTRPLPGTARYTTEYDNEVLKLCLSDKTVHTLPKRVQLHYLTTVFIRGRYTFEKNILVSMSAFKYCSRLRIVRLENTVVTDETVHFSPSIEKLSIWSTVLQICTTADIIEALPIGTRSIGLEAVRTDETDGTSGVTDEVHDLTGIGRLHNLQYLSISNMSIRLPTDISRLTSLKQWVISKCPDTPIPDDIAVLTSLLDLRMPGCNITEIPDSLYEMKQLKYINLSYNQITDASVLERLCSISNLHYLWIEGNGMTGQLPPVSSLSKLTNLQHLCIANNDLEGELTDEVVSSLPSLTTLSANNNSRLTVSISR